MKTDTFLLYGANGYTGQLIAELAQQYGLRPILAGRNAPAIADMASRLDLPYEAFELNNTQALHKALERVQVVLHAAGPFQHTADPMVDACLQTKTHYLDITGEIAVFESVKKKHQEAESAGIMLMPGVGFDVVPTDCMALFLKNSLPDSTDLKLAFASRGGGISQGTANTLVETLGSGSAIRQDGNIRKVPLAHKGMWVDFGIARRFVATIPWGDVSTAYTTTQIPNIEVYTAIPPFFFGALKAQPLFNWILRSKSVKKLLKGRIKNGPAGPSAANRSDAKGMVWGKVYNDAGKTSEARLIGPDGYTLTAHAGLVVAKKVLNRSFKKGYQTPAGCYGADLVLEIPGVSREVL